MDPFNTLYESTTPLIDQLEKTSSQSLDFLTLQNEIISCIQDLNQSIQTVENERSLLNDNPFSDISNDELKLRKEKVNALNHRMRSILDSKNISNLKGGYSINPFDDQNQITKSSLPPSQYESDSPPELDSATREYHQQLLQEQDDLISNELTNSINNLHRQAVNINSELEIQDSLLSQVGNDIENLNFKILNNGVKRINNFLETSEMGGNCCIAILIVVLIIILVLLIII